MTGLRGELENITAKCAALGFWPDGWLSVRRTRFYDEKDKESENYSRLTKLEEMLRPRHLVEQVRGRVLTPNNYDVDDVDLEDVNKFQLAILRLQEEAESLGCDVAKDPIAFANLLPQIIGTEAANIWNFGMGLAKGATDPKRLWQQLVQQFADTPSEKRNTRLLTGFLSQLGRIKSPLVDEFLDRALENEPLAPYFPFLQAAVPITVNGMARLRRSIELGKVPSYIYANSFHGSAVEVVPASEIAAYILALSKLPEGESAAIQLLIGLFFVDRNNKRAHAKEIVDVGRALLRNLNFDRSLRRDNYHLKEMVEVCASGDGGYEVARTLCENFSRAVAGRRAYGWDHNYLLRAIFKIQPKAALDALLLGDRKFFWTSVQLIGQSSHRGNPVDEVNEVTLFAWCDRDPMGRFPAVAGVVSAFTLTTDGNPTAWNPIAMRLVHAAPDPVAVMQAFVSRFRPMSWSGSRSTILRANAILLGQFDVQGNAALATFVAAQMTILEQEARDYLRWEAKRDGDRYERFE